MAPLRAKAVEQGEYFRRLLDARLGDAIRVITPADASGCQLSLEVVAAERPGREVYEQLEGQGFRTDWRNPNVIRAAPTPLYNSFEDIWRFVDGLADCLSAKP